MPPINIYQFIILVVLALVLFGPERLPQYARTLAQWTRRVRHWADDAKVRFRDETGTDFDDVDWQKYDPRQYDPRRIIRDALAEELDDFDLPGSAGSRAAQHPPSRGKPVDPLELFSAGDAPSALKPSIASETSAQAQHSSRLNRVYGGGDERRGAVAAGVAGAAAEGAGAAGSAAALPGQADLDEDPLISQRAPFDSEAT